MTDVDRISGIDWQGKSGPHSTILMEEEAHGYTVRIMLGPWIFWPSSIRRDARWPDFAREPLGVDDRKWITYAREPMVSWCVLGDDGAEHLGSPIKPTDVAARSVNRDEPLPNRRTDTARWVDIAIEIARNRARAMAKKLYESA